MQRVLEWPQSHALHKTINMITNKYETQQKCRFGTVSKKLLGGFNRFYGYPTSPSASIMAQNIQLFGSREGFLTHQWIITLNSTETCCDRHLEIPGVSNNTTGTLEQKKTNIEPRWGKQQTKKLRPKPTIINSFMSGPSLSLTPDPPACNQRGEQSY